MIFLSWHMLILVCRKLPLFSPICWQQQKLCKLLLRNFLIKTKSSDNLTDDFALFEGKGICENEVLIYLCRNYACEKPVKSIEELILLLKNKKYTITNYDSR